MVVVTKWYTVHVATSAALVALVTAALATIYRGLCVGSGERAEESLLPTDDTESRTKDSGLSNYLSKQSKLRTYDHMWFLPLSHSGSTNTP